MQVMLGHYQLSRKCEVVDKLEKTESQMHMCTRWVWTNPTQTMSPEQIHVHRCGDCGDQDEGKGQGGHGGIRGQGGQDQGGHGGILDHVGQGGHGGHEIGHEGTNVGHEVGHESGHGAGHEVGHEAGLEVGHGGHEAGQGGHGAQLPIKLNNIFYL